MNNTVTRHIKTFAALALCVLILNSCVDDLWSNLFGQEGKPITFTALTTWENAPAEVATKTVYSGDRVYKTSTPHYERINWLSSDIILVKCPQAQVYGKEADGKRWELVSTRDTASYKVIPTTEQSGDKEHDAKVTNLTQNNTGNNVQDTDNGLQWGTGKHYFYALYPSPAMKGEHLIDGPSIVSVGTAGTNVAHIKGEIPAEQNPVSVTNLKTIIRTGDYAGSKNQWDVIEHEPDMFYAAMAAYAEADPGSEVSLRFKPLVTTLRVELKADERDAMAGTSGADLVDVDATYGKRFKLPLTQLELVSEDKSLAGPYHVTIGGATNGDTPKEYVTYNTTEVTNGHTGNTITIKTPANTYLYTGVPSAFTFLCRPVDQTNLTLKLTFSDGLETVTRKLELKENASTPLIINERQKLYLDAVAVNSLYVIDAELTTVQGWKKNDYTFRVTESKNISSGQEVDADWWIEYSTDGGSTFTTTPPAWLSGLPANGKGKSTETTTVEVSRTAFTWNESWPTDTCSKAIDMIRDATYYPTLNPKQETANCYIVDGPGWFCFPCNYGNSLHGSGLATKGKAFNRDGTYDGESKLFRDHNYSDIKSPWIRSQLGIGNWNFTDHSAELLWQDAKNLISEVRLGTSSGGVFKSTFQYIKEGSSSATSQFWIAFKVDPFNITPGNAVIALKINGTIVWSWHIWVVPKGKLNTVEVRPWDPDDTSGAAAWASSVTSNMMLNVNLGYRDAEPDYPGSQCIVRVRNGGKYKDLTLDNPMRQGHPAGFPLYQWGRKDPMGVVICTENGVTGEAPLYDIKGNSVEITHETTPAGNIGKTIQNPMLFYQRAADGDWSSFRWDNLWNTNVTTKVSAGDNQDLPVYKTIYDPCPPGYKIPNEYAFTGFHKQPNVQESQLAIDATDPTAIEGDDPAKYINGTPTTTYKGCLGMMLNSAEEGKPIFFPTTGRRNGALESSTYQRIDDFQLGYYWTAAPYKTLEFRYGRCMSFDCGMDQTTFGLRYDTWLLPVIGKNTNYRDKNNEEKKLKTGFFRTHAFGVRPVEQDATE